jgi:hypothetical protein
VVVTETGWFLVPVMDAQPVVVNAAIQISQVTFFILSPSVNSPKVATYTAAASKHVAWAYLICLSDNARIDATRFVAFVG